MPARRFSKCRQPITTIPATIANCETMAMMRAVVSCTARRLASPGSGGSAAASGVKKMRCVEICGSRNKSG